MWVGVKWSQMMVYMSGEGGSDRAGRMMVAGVEKTGTDESMLEIG